MALTDGTLAHRDHQVIDGLLKTYTGSNPAGGAEFTETVPANKCWNLLGVSVANVQAGAGTSLPVLVVDDGTRIVFESMGNTIAQGITTTWQYTWGPNLLVTSIAAATTPAAAMGGLPQPFFIGTGFKVRTITTGLSANTDYGAPTFYVVEYEVT